MRILTIHNSYQQTGGEDTVFVAEASLLRQYGHEVVEYHQDNGRICTLSRHRVAMQTIWSQPAYTELRQLVRDVQPDVTHVHNTFVLISPSAYYASKGAGVPVVQTLHNYRLLCPAATLFRNGRVCEECLGITPPWPAVLHACYRHSHAQSAVTTTMLTFHRWLKTWQERVDLYIALTEFARRKFIRGGLPADKIVVKPNFVFPDPGKREGAGNYALYVGRLSAEKGVHTLLKAWGQLRGISLRVAGDGPLLEEATMMVRRHGLKDITLMGRVPPRDVLASMKGAKLLIFPSEWYEGLPMTLIEAFACGLPVIASRLGAMAEMVDEGHTGLLFRPGDPEDLAAKVRWAVEHPEAMDLMGAHARHVYEEKYTSDLNYHMLINIYRTAISAAQLRQP
jgi:glycosyltransferase involved in cell wall biosynthesis